MTERQTQASGKQEKKTSVTRSDFSEGARAGNDVGRPEVFTPRSETMHYYSRAANGRRAREKTSSVNEHTFRHDASAQAYTPSVDTSFSRAIKVVLLSSSSYAVSNNTQYNNTYANTHKLTGISMKSRFTTIYYVTPLRVFQKDKYKIIHYTVYQRLLKTDPPLITACTRINRLPRHRHGRRKTYRHEAVFAVKRVAYVFLMICITVHVFTDLMNVSYTRVLTGAQCSACLLGHDIVVDVTWGKFRETH